MLITYIAPDGIICRLNLDMLPIWRIELGATGSRLAVGIRYVAAGATAFAAIAAVDTRGADGEVKQIARVGMSKKTRKANIERLVEAIKILYNSVNALKGPDVDELATKVPDLVGCYYDLKQCLLHQSEGSGEALGTQWAVHRQAAVPALAQDAGKQVAGEKADTAGDE